MFHYQYIFRRSALFRFHIMFKFRVLRFHWEFLIANLIRRAQIISMFDMLLRFRCESFPRRLEACSCARLCLWFVLFYLFLGESRPRRWDSASNSHSFVFYNLVCSQRVSPLQVAIVFVFAFVVFSAFSFCFAASFSTQVGIVGVVKLLLRITILCVFFFLLF